eukprot:m.60256 g.60256  ORF g.60256 m.60256 type:complete len:67 (+) comp7933_c0_seq8:683-883(+)
MTRMCQYEERRNTKAKISQRCPTPRQTMIQSMKFDCIFEPVSHLQLNNLQCIEERGERSLSLAHNY